MDDDVFLDDEMGMDDECVEEKKYTLSCKLIIFHFSLRSYEEECCKQNKRPMGHIAHTSSNK